MVQSSWLRWGYACTAALLLSAGAVGCGEAKLAAKVEAKTPEPEPKPPADADGDGVLDDGTDKCVGEKEDNLPPDPKDGCVSKDPDGDGILGDADKCPDKPETKNEFEDEDGCPDEKPRVQVTATEVKINEKILFEFGKSTIDKKSDDLIKNIAEVVIKHPQIEFIEIAGHADKVGSDPGNVILTKSRSAAVLAALVKNGVNAKRMRPVGYGRYCPVDPGDSEEAREKNRRVEFKILKMDGKETGVVTGCEEAAKNNIKPQPVPAGIPTKEENQKDADKLAGKPAEPKPADAKPADAPAAPKPLVKPRKK